MKINNIKTLMLASAFSMFAIIGLSACNTGTDPGETNTERGKIEKEGKMVEGSNDDPMGQYRDTTDAESHYDHTKTGKEGAVHSGSGKKGDANVERDDVDNN